jgi:hypothetical protein
MIVFPEGEVRVLKLHGSFPATDNLVAAEVILDRPSFDAAFLSDSSLRAVLDRLFEDFAGVVGRIVMDGPAYCP